MTLHERVFPFFEVLTYGTLIIILFLAALVVFQPYCPTEDSCHADYYNGAWHIVENQP